MHTRVIAFACFCPLLFCCRTEAFSTHLMSVCWYELYGFVLFFEKVPWNRIDNIVQYSKGLTSYDDSFCMKLCDSHIDDLYTDTSELRAIK